jgi:hypothetical protein
MPGASKPGWSRLLFGFERRHHGLLPWPAFRRRLLVNFAVGLALILLSLLVGMIGYSVFAGLDATDSFLNAAMILSGMGPVDALTTPAAKIFAGIYALYSGVAVLAVAGLVFAPLIHRLLHHFHVEDDASPAPDENPRTRR